MNKSYKWRIFLSILGFVIGNIIGLVIGFFIGYSLDTSKNSIHNVNEAAEQESIDTIFILLGYLIRIKGNVIRKDVDAVNAYFDRHSINDHDRDHYIEMLNVSRDHNINIEELLDNFRRTPHQFKHLCAVTLIEIIVNCSDGVPDSRTLSELHRICRRLGFSPSIVNAYIDLLNKQKNKHNYQHQYNYEDYEEFNSRQGGGNYHSAYSSDMTLEAAYLELNITSETEEKVAKRAYLKLIKEYHPDKFASAAQHIRDDMSAKAQRINSAWDTVKEYKGWR